MNKKKIIDLRIKLKTNYIMIKRLEIKIKNQNIKGQTLNIIKYWVEVQNWNIKIKFTRESKTKIKNQENEDQIWKNKHKIMDPMMKVKIN